MRKIGILISEPTSRPDLFGFLGALSQKTNVTVFKESTDTKYSPRSEFKLHLLDRRTPNAQNKILRKLFTFLGQKPSPRRFIRSYEIRRLDKLEGSAAKRIYTHCLIRLRSWSPGLIRYDTFLRLMTVRREYLDAVENLDCLFVVSDVADDEILAAATQSGIPVIYYVYSWDHAPKFSRIPTQGSVVATWSKPIEDDVKAMHNVPRERFARLPPTQYAGIEDYLHELKSSGVEPERKNQLLFAASFGYPSLAKLEVNLFVEISKMCAARYPDLELIFRGYPHLAKSEIYAQLRELPNVRIDESIFAYNRGLGYDHTRNKVDLIRESIALLHCGTTVGIEAALCGTPVIYINIETSKETPSKGSPRLAESWKQYHLQKYYYSPGSSNTALTLEELDEAIDLAIEDPKKLLSPYGEDLIRLAGASTTNELVQSTRDLTNRVTREALR